MPVLGWRAGQTIPLISEDLWRQARVEQVAGFEVAEPEPVRAALTSRQGSADRLRLSCSLYEQTNVITKQPVPIDRSYGHLLVASLSRGKSGGSGCAGGYLLRKTICQPERHRHSHNSQ